MSVCPFGVGRGVARRGRGAPRRRAATIRTARSGLLVNVGGSRCRARDGTVGRGKEAERMKKLPNSGPAASAAPVPRNGREGGGGLGLLRRVGRAGGTLAAPSPVPNKLYFRGFSIKGRAYPAMRNQLARTPAPWARPAGPPVGTHVPQGGSGIPKNRRPNSCAPWGLPGRKPSRRPEPRSPPPAPGNRPRRCGARRAISPVSAPRRSCASTVPPLDVAG